MRTLVLSDICQITGLSLRGVIRDLRASGVAVLADASEWTIAWGAVPDERWALKLGLDRPSGMVNCAPSDVSITRDLKVELSDGNLDDLAANSEAILTQVHAWEGEVRRSVGYLVSPEQRSVWCRGVGHVFAPDGVWFGCEVTVAAASVFASFDAVERVATERNWQKWPEFSEADSEPEVGERALAEENVAIVLDTEHVNHAPGLALAVRLWLDLFAGGDEPPGTTSYGDHMNKWLDRKTRNKELIKRIRLLAKPERGQTPGPRPHPDDAKKDRSSK